MTATLFASNGRPLTLTKPRAASSADMARNDDRLPPGGFRRSRLASATTSGRSSRCDRRPSTLAPVARLRSRAALSFALPSQTGLSRPAPAAPEPRWVCRRGRSPAHWPGPGRGPARADSHVRRAAPQSRAQPVRRLDDDGAHAVADQRFKHGREAGSRNDRVGAAQRRVAIPARPR